MNMLKKNLDKLGLDETQLSNNEIAIITRIQKLYDDIVAKNKTLKTELQNNKFSRTVINDAEICSRQTLYKNEIISNYVDLLIEQSNQLSEVNESKYVSREKYNDLKRENSLLISNAVDVAIKDSEIARLNEENKRLNDRITNLVKQLEKERSGNVTIKNKKNFA